MDKLIYGMARVKFDGVEIGWFDEQGLTPAGVYLPRWTFTRPR